MLRKTLAVLLFLNALAFLANMLFLQNMKVWFGLDVATIALCGAAGWMLVKSK
jgi:hypothetical protein